jgi:hypothetical protein
VSSVYITNTQTPRPEIRSTQYNVQSGTTQCRSPSSELGARRGSKPQFHVFQPETWAAPEACSLQPYRDLSYAHLKYLPPNSASSTPPEHRANVRSAGECRHNSPVRQVGGSSGFSVTGSVTGNQAQHICYMPHCFKLLLLHPRWTLSRARVQRVCATPATHGCACCLPPLSSSASSHSANEGDPHYRNLLQCTIWGWVISGEGCFGGVLFFVLFLLLLCALRRRRIRRYVPVSCQHRPA